MFKRFKNSVLRFKNALVASCCLVTTAKSRRGNVDNSWRASNNIFSNTFQLNDRHDPLYHLGLLTNFP